MILGEEKPQPFIPLDIDRQLDGKLVTNNNTSFSPPNGRLSTPVNYLSNNVTGILPQLVHQQQQQQQQNPALTVLPVMTTAATTFAFDAGIHQGHPSAQVNEWNPNMKVKFFHQLKKCFLIIFDEMKFSFLVILEYRIINVYNFPSFTVS